MKNRVKELRKNEKLTQEEGCLSCPGQLGNVRNTIQNLVIVKILLDENTIKRMWIMRKYLSDMNPVEAMDFINDRFKKTKNNEEFLISMNN